MGDTVRRLEVITTAYGLTSRAGLIDTVLWWQDRCGTGIAAGTVLWWQDRCATGIAAGADAGDPVMVHLVGSGALDEVRAAHRWTITHHDRPAR
ncbi:hypothetical protein [Actinoplanes sp. NPDC020271]|uniref:hypothetical protein n=1 Tax=Actinoplanes sp. NPDC020271 TaxID=3363896 RepID=UPI00379A12D7